VSPIAAPILNDLEDEFDETPENIARFCTALTFVDPSDYHGNPHSYPDVDPNFCLGWFEGICGIKSLPWRQEVKERIAIWWSKRTRRDNYPGDDGVLHKLNHDPQNRRRHHLSVSPARRHRRAGATGADLHQASVGLAAAVVLRPRCAALPSHLAI
jgi:hypothetical protein